MSEKGFFVVMSEVLVAFCLSEKRFSAIATPTTFLPSGSLTGVFGGRGFFAGGIVGRRGRSCVEGICRNEAFWG